MKNVSPYLKMRVLGAIDYAEGKSRRDRIKKVAALTFIDEEGNPRKFTWKTISTWYCRYTKDGITGMKNNERSDKGLTRKITPEQLLEAINEVLPLFRQDDHFNKMEVYRKIIEKGIISKDQLAQTTFYRFIREYDLLDKKQDTEKKRLAFAMQYANQLWQGDTMFGPYVRDESGKSIQTKLIALEDDASRLLVHGQFFHSENTDALITVLKSAFYKRGIPEQMYLDNGGIYTSKEITMICARTGCILRHTPVRDGAAKGKIERFFRRVRDQFLSRNLDLSNLSSLNNQFTSWVEDEYNSSVHSAIGMKPVDRFALDLNRIRFLDPNQAHDELFFAEDTRKVKNDNTFQFLSIRYETPTDLRGKQITIRYDRKRKDRIIIYYKNKRIGEAKKLNLIENGKLKRSKRQEDKS